MALQLYNIAVYYSVLGHKSASAPLMQCNLFIIISVNIIGVNMDKHICDTCYSHMCLGAGILEETAPKKE